MGIRLYFFTNIVYNKMNYIGREVLNPVWSNFLRRNIIKEEG